ncbi:MAG: hypothetical protein ACRDGF_06170 [Chloroflexota bacterium]
MSNGTNMTTISGTTPSITRMWKQCVPTATKLGLKASPLVLFFTDGHRQGAIRAGIWKTPDGERRELNLTERRKVINFYLPRYIYPWFGSFIAPWRVVRKLGYLRGMQTYWGTVITRP